MNKEDFNTNNSDNRTLSSHNISPLTKTSTMKNNLYKEISKTVTILSDSDSVEDNRTW